MRWLILLLGAAVCLAALATLRSRDNGPLVRLSPPGGMPEHDHELPKYWPLPDFSLTDRHGHPVTLADLRGKIWVADFFYATCPGPCPMLSTHLAEIQKKLKDQADVRFVSITTDPDQDTPEVLSAYARRFSAGDHWLFLTGDKAQIFALSNQGFKLSATEDPKAPEPITHSTKFALVDQSGYVRGFYDGIDAAAAIKLIDDIHRLEATPR